MSTTPTTTPKPEHSPSRARRARRPKALPAQSDGAQPYALQQEVFAGLSDGEMLTMVLRSAAWKDVMVPILEELDAERRGGRKRQGGFKNCYTSEQLETALLFGALVGAETTKAAVDTLGGSDNRHRLALGFLPKLVEDHPRPKTSRRTRGLPMEKCRGVPSEATLSRHKARFGHERRERAYRALFERFLSEHAATPEFRDEAREIYQDGFEMNTIYWPPTGPKGGASTAHQRKVTCPEGGYRPIDSDGKGGRGFKPIITMTASGLIIDFETQRMHDGEPAAGAAQITRFGEKLRPLLGDPTLGVLVTDGAYCGQKNRRAARAAGLIENTMLASRGSSDATQRNVTARNEFKYRIEKFPNWLANGHREIACKCGDGHVSWRTGLDSDGHTWSRIEGACANCGPIAITSGIWRLDRNSQKFVVCERGHKDADHAFGNGLTYNSPLAKTYASQRFGRNEGVHGVLVTRFGIGDGKQRWRTKNDVDTRLAMIACLMHGLALEQRSYVRGQQAALAPPALAA